MKIGVLGGTFDPIHNGHLELARAAQNQYGLDEIWFVPASIPPHKVSSSDRASSKHRFEMVKLAAASEPRFKVSDEELSREGISYTYDTLQSFSRKKPEAHFFLIMGEDAYRDFDGWRNSLKIREIASILVASRPGQKKASGSEDSPGVFRVKMPECGASSRSIRSRIRQKTTEGLEIHPAVLGYILEHKLYGS